MPANNSSDGKMMPPFFINHGTKGNTKFYLEEVIPKIEEWCEAEYGAAWRRHVALMQDGAPCHTANTI